MVVLSHEWGPNPSGTPPPPNEGCKYINCAVIWLGWQGLTQARCWRYIDSQPRRPMKHLITLLARWPQGNIWC